MYARYFVALARYAKHSVKIMKVLSTIVVALAELNLQLRTNYMMVAVTNKEICLVRTVFMYEYNGVSFCSLGY